jgi:hypothetical protein
MIHRDFAAISLRNQTLFPLVKIDLRAAESPPALFA